MINAVKVVNKSLTDLKIVLNGLGASGIATARLLLKMGIKNLTLFDIDGQVHPDSENYNQYQREVAQASAVQDHFADLSTAMKGQDVFIGLSTADVLTAADVETMANDPIIFALANPKPEIDPALAKDGGATVIATGSSQYPNQVNNILAFSGLYKGLLQTDIKQVTLELETQIARSLANMIRQPEAGKIIPGVFDDGVVETVSQSVIDFAKVNEE